MNAASAARMRVSAKLGFFFSFFDSAICAPVEKVSTYSSRKVASLVAVKAIQFIYLSDPIAASLSWEKKKGGSKRNDGGGC